MMTEPTHEKTQSGVSTRSDTNRSVLSQKQARSFGLKKKWDCTVCVAKTKTLISCAVNAQLICVFVFAYAGCWFSYSVAQVYRCSGHTDSDSSAFSCVIHLVQTFHTKAR